MTQPALGDGAPGLGTTIDASLDSLLWQKRLLRLSQHKDNEVGYAQFVMDVRVLLGLF